MILEPNQLVMQLVIFFSLEIHCHCVRELRLVCWIMRPYAAETNHPS